MPLPFNLRNLEAFEVVATLGSISDAARKLGKAQPALSRQIRILEEEVGAKLFERDHEGVRLTRAGARLRDATQPWLRRLDQLVADLKEHDAVPQIRLGALAEIGQILVLPRVMELVFAGAQFEFSMEYNKEFELLAKLTDQELDAVVVTSNNGGPGTEASLLQEERCVLVTRTQHQVIVEADADLQGLRFLVYRPGDPLLRAYLEAHHPGVSIDSVDVAVAVNSHRSMLDVLHAMDLVAVMPLQSVGPALASRTLRRVSPKELRGKLHLLMQEEFAHSALGARLREHLGS